MTKTAKRLTPSEIDAVEQLALDIFRDAYLGQWRRVRNAIQRASPNILAGFDAAEFWEDEPELVEQSVRRWYDDTFERTGRSVFDDLDLETEWADVNDSLLKTSAERAGWFSKAMTETSIEQSQKVINKWLDIEGGTIGELQDSMQGIWTGPRPDVAALTETTNIATQAQVVNGKAAGFWGYNVRTRNDSSVRPEHTEIADNGPYPFSDTEHMPPLDYNCRCFITYVREEPSQT